MKNEKVVKIKIKRPCIAKGKVTAKGTVLSMKESEARIFLKTGKAVVADAATKED